jgi:hypothetical protein
VVPRVERGEFLNVGVVLFSRELDVLDARIELDEARLASLAPNVDIELIKSHLDTFKAVADGAQAGGPIAALPRPERFYWLVSPRSTAIQTSPVHVGRSNDATAAMNALLDEFVRPPQAAGAAGA